ncbi:hypothetical protein SDJN02_13773, partial [Cucurbita argyrosperma subsp. argyrosperma]
MKVKLWMDKLHGLVNYMCIKTNLDLEARPCHCQGLSLKIEPGSMTPTGIDTKKIKDEANVIEDNKSRRKQSHSIAAAVWNLGREFQVTSSRASMNINSLTLLRILPLGVESKNDMGARKMLVCILTKSSVAALKPAVTRRADLKKTYKELPMAKAT